MSVVVPAVIRMHEGANAAIVGKDGGLPAGTPLPGGPTPLQMWPLQKEVQRMKHRHHANARTLPTP